MQTIDSILVPVDFSEISANAYRYTLQLADRLKAEVHLLYSIPPAASTADVGSFAINLLEDLRRNASAGMEEFMKEAREPVASELKDAPVVKTFIKVGDLGVVLREHAEKENSRLIIMGTHGYDHGWDELLGTNTVSVLGRTPCPLLVIPKGCAYRPLDNICFATDLKHADAFQADALLTAILPFRPAVNFVHVSQEDEETAFGLDSLRKMFDRPDSDIKSTFVSLKRDDVVEGLFGYAHEHGNDLVVMSRPNRGWFSRLFSKSHTKDAVKYASLPLLILSTKDLVSG